MQRALDIWIWWNGCGCEGERCVVRNADICRCFTDNDKGLNNWF